MSKTLYKRLIEICAKEFVVNKLSENNFTTFVDFLYDDLRKWDRPTDASDVEIIHRIEEHLSFMVSRILVDTHTGTTHD